MGILCYCW